MGKILLITGGRLGIPSANRNCMINVVRALKDLGEEVFLLCRAKEEDTPEEALASFPVYTVEDPEKKAPPSFFPLRKAINICNRIRSFFRPNMIKPLARNYYTKLIEVCDEQGIDTVVVPFYPPEAVDAIRRLKIHRPHIKTAIYELDSVGDGIWYPSFTNNLTLRAVNRFLKKAYKRVDQIHVLVNHKDYWLNNFGEVAKDKLSFMDIPVLMEPPAVSSLESAPSSSPCFLYSGELSQTYRSPVYLLQLLEALANSTAFTFHFFSKGDCEDMLADASGKITGICQHGYVSTTALNEAVAQADILVNIGNAVSNSVPSKLIFYMSFGKPILHIASNKEDVCNAYLEKYPLALVLEESEDMAVNAKKLSAFIQKVNGKAVGFDEVKALYPMNDPVYSAKLFL